MAYEAFRNLALSYYRKYSQIICLQFIHWMWHVFTGPCASVHRFPCPECPLPLQHLAKFHFLLRQQCLRRAFLCGVPSTCFHSAPSLFPSQQLHISLKLSKFYYNYLFVCLPSLPDQPSSAGKQWLYLEISAFPALGTGPTTQWGVNTCVLRSEYVNV